LVNQISERYIELYENIIGEKFVRSDVSNVLSRVEKNVTGWIEKN
jgi:phosphoribosylaminoimidazole-succinocarboxamide synthase